MSPMKDNYHYINRMTKLYAKKIYLLVLAMMSLISAEGYSQCSTPPVGCTSTNLSNFGFVSDNNAATIEYDNFTGAFHSTVVRTSTGTFQIWGENMGANGTDNLLSPLDLNSVNYTAIGTSTPLKVALGSNSAQVVQGVLLTTDGLYAWSKEGAVLDNTLTSSAVFQKITVNGQANGLPAGVVPGDIKMMFGTYQTLVITTCSGAAWVLSQNAVLRANGSTGSNTAWSQIKTNATTTLTNVVACRGTSGTLMALTSDGSVYVWGTNVYLGDGSAAATQTYATQMILPKVGGVTITPKMIGATNSLALLSYYVLDTTGNLYAVGDNSKKQLGDWTTTNRAAWVQPRYTSTVGPVMDNVKWISPKEHDTQYGAINVINNSKQLYSFGENSFGMLSGALATLDPTIPAGVVSSDAILGVETGGHTTMIVKECAANFGYVGHRIRGSMADGTNNSDNQTTFNFATAPVQVCGVESIPTIQPVTFINGANGKYCSDSAIIVSSSPAGGTLIKLGAGPGTLTGNTLQFTGVGTVTLQYTLATACGGSSVTTKAFTSEICETDVQTVKTVDVSSPAIGGTVVFTITVKNNGPIDARNVKAVDTVPAGYTVTGVVPSGLTTWSAPNWTIGTLANGASETLKITATVNATGVYTNTTTVTNDVTDTNLLNNTSSVCITPVKPLITSVAATCSAAGTSTISNYNPSNVYTFTPATAGITISASGLINGLTTGTSYIVSSKNGTCASVDSASFSNAVQFAAPTISTAAAATAITCNGLTDGKVSVTGTGGTGALVYNLLTSATSGGTYVDATATNGDANGQYTGLPKGFYKVTITDSKSCGPTTSLVVEVVEPAAITISSAAAATAITCNGLTDGKVSVTATGGTGTLVYNLLTSATSGGIYTNATATNGDTNGQYTGLPKGFYKVTITDSKSCGPTTSTVVEVVEPSLPVVSTITPDTKTEGTVNNDLVHTVTLDKASACSTLISFSLVDNTTSPADHGTPTFSNGVTYDNVTGKITVPAGVTTFTVTVTVTEDAIADSGEFYDLTIGGVATKGTINDETLPYDPANPNQPNGKDAGTQISIAGAATTVEGTGVEYTVSVTNAPLTDMSVVITTSNVTTNGDVIVGTQTVTILAGTKTAKFTVANTQDGIKENPEDYTVAITSYTTGGYEAVSTGVTSVTTTITDNDIIVVSAITPDTKTEGTPSNDLVHTVTMSGISVNPETYTFTLVDNTTSPADHGTPTFSNGVTYDNVTGKITVPAGVATFTVTVTVTDDAIADSGEFYDLTIGGVATKGTINDETLPYDPANPNQPNGKDAGTQISIAGATTTVEGTGVEYTVSVTNAPLTDMSVVITTSNVTTNGDVIVGTQTVTILAGTKTVKFTVANTQDGIKENPEDYTVAITSYTTGGYEAVSAGVTSVTTTITDNDIIVVSAVTPDTKTEGTPSNDLVHTVTMSGISVNPETYTFTLVDNTTSPADHGTPTFSNGVTYDNVTGKITVPAGVTTFTVTVTVTDDALSETSEFYDITVGTQVSKGTIVDNDAPTVTISGSTTVAEDGIPNATITVSISNPATTPVVVTLTATGTATNGTDYTGVPVTVTIPAGSTSVTFDVDPTPDMISEGNETVIIDITGVTGGNGAVESPTPQTAIVTIIDNDITVVTIDNATIVEGGKLNFPITLSNPSSKDITLTFSYTNTTASAADYTQTATITIPAGTTTATLVVQTIEDTIDEVDETFVLGISASNVAGVVITDTAIGKILDNDIDAVNDNTYPVQIPNTLVPVTVGNVTTNDTVHGILVTPANTDVTPITTGPLTINSEGVLTLAPNTPIGTYTIVYQLCEVAVPGNCDTATVTVKVGAVIIEAFKDDYTTTPVPSFPGGTTPSVILNDKLNDLPAIIGTVPGQVKLTPVTVPSGLTLNPNGTVTVASNTAAGTYTVTYSICEVINPTNCSTATATVVVSAQKPSIALVKTATAVDENGDGFTTVGETIRYNFRIVNTGNVPLTNITISDLLPGLVLKGGPITLAAGQEDTTSFVGTYVVTQADANNEQVENQATVFGTSPLGIIVKDLSDNYSTTSDGGTVLTVKNCVVVVSNAFTPNGDGLNEYFHIEGLDCFTNNTVEIYNRWGVLVFESSKYNNVDNRFEGFSKGRTTISQSVGLPTGTYYYIINYVDFSGNGVQKAGYLFLNR